MPGGRGNIRPEDNPKPFKKGDNTNPEGRGPVSIRKQIRELMQADGKIKFDWKEVVSFKEGEYVELKMPNKQLVAMKLFQWAMSRKDTASVKAIQMLIDNIDGKVAQNLNLNAGETLNIDPKQWVGGDDK